LTSMRPKFLQGINARLPPGLSRYMPDLWVLKICERQE